MAYKQSPASFVKHKSKAVGYMAVGSAFHLDPDPNEKEKKEKQSAKDKFQNAYLNKGGDIKKLQEATNRVIDEKGNVRANPGSIREYDSTVK
jgi:hypothetical protein